MARTYDEDGTMTNSISERQKKKMASADFFGVPKDVRDASKRLYGPGPFDVKDKKKVQDYYRNKKGKA